MARIIVEIGATFDAQPRAVIPAQRLEWQIKHDLVTKQRLEVDEVALQPASDVIVRLDSWVDVQLLDGDVQLIGDVTKASHALPTDLDRGAAAYQHSLDHRLKPEIELDRRSQGYADHADSQVRRSLDGCSNHDAARLTPDGYDRRPRRNSGRRRRRRNNLVAFGVNSRIDLDRRAEYLNRRN